MMPVRRSHLHLVWLTDGYVLLASRRIGGDRGSVPSRNDLGRTGVMIRNRCGMPMRIVAASTVPSRPAAGWPQISIAS